MRTTCLLKDMWFGLFDNESCAKDNDFDDDYQGLLMLLHTALAKTKYISLNNNNLKITSEKCKSELQWKTEECCNLMAEIQRLETSQCHKCVLLETEVILYKKKATEAQNRMKSIANILKLGDNVDDSQGLRKNSAMNLVSQMLLCPESPKRKKRVSGRHSSSLPVNTMDKKLLTSIHNCETIVPETEVAEILHNIQTPEKKLDHTEIITSPGDSEPLKNIKDRTALSIKLPIISNKRSPRVIRKNLSTDFEKQDNSHERSKDFLKFNIDIAGPSQDLNGSLDEYVRDANSELDKIWFAGDESKSTKTTNEESKIVLTPSTRMQVEGIVEETPEVNIKNKWKMKEVRGPLEIAGGKKVKQMKLQLGTKTKRKEVNLCSLEGYDGGSVNNSTYSTNGDTDRTSQNFACSSMSSFKPIASSTQMTDSKPTKTTSKSNTSPKYVYKRDAVKKKSERAKLQGWDCENCAAYYGTVAQFMTAEEIKERKNKCSRHRDKFGQHNQTPTDYWNPIFPDTQECKEKGMYVSLHIPRDTP